MRFVFEIPDTFAAQPQTPAALAGEQAFSGGAAPRTGSFFASESALQAYSAGAAEFAGQLAGAAAGSGELAQDGGSAPR